MRKRERGSDWMREGESAIVRERDIKLKIEREKEKEVIEEGGSERAKERLKLKIENFILLFN